jgi:hypothetical protein
LRGEGTGGTGVFTGAAEAKACGYISSWYVGLDIAKCLPDRPAPAPEHLFSVSWENDTILPLLKQIYKGGKLFSFINLGWQI